MVISASAGAGFAVVFSLIVAAVFWYRLQPKPPTPWNTTAITAKFDLIATEGTQKTLVFYYHLQNTTDTDYRVGSVPPYNVMIMAKTKSLHVSSNAIRSREGSEILPIEELQTLEPSGDWLSMDDSVFIPAKQTVRVAVRLGYAYAERLKMNPTSDEKRAYQEKLAVHVADRFSTLDGFVVFDEWNRYQIDLPRGW